MADDHRGKSLPTCPYCDAVERDYYDLTGSDGTTECQRCGKEYEYTVNTEITFDTKPIKEGET